MKKKNIILAMACLVALSFSANAQPGNPVEDAASKAINDKVSIEKIPATLEEFQALQAELGTTPEGCIMLQLAAMEMYRRDRNVGLECLRLNNTDTNLSSVQRRLNELFRENDSYARPYLVAACFKGATPANGYNPTKPFTIELRKDPNRQDERSQIRNREKCLATLKARILDFKRREEEAKLGASRLTLRGSGDRSERIRTYNFPQNRLTDHRIGLTLYRLNEVIAGDLDPVLEPARAWFQAEQLRAEEAGF